MSDDNSETTLTQFSKSATGYGPIITTILTAVAVLLPQFFIGIVLLIPYGLGLKINEDSLAYVFVLNALIETITVGLIYLFLRMQKKTLGALFGKVKKWWHFWLVPLAFVCYFACLLVAYGIVERYFTTVNLDQVQENPFKQAAGHGEIVLAFFALIVITPIVEELIFRGFLYKGLKSNMPKLLAALLTSGLFALAHGQLNVGIDTFILSMFLILLLEKTDSLIPSIMLHALKNTVAFVAIFSGKF